MFKIATKYIKPFVAPLLGITILFFAIVFFQNHTTLIVSMSTPQQDTLQPKLYYASKGEPFSETKSKKAFKVQNNQYFFSLQDIKRVKNIRFDPSITKNNIFISKIILIQSKWFKTTIFELPVENLKPLNQIKNYHKTDKSIEFSTLGNDPQLSAEFSPKFISTAKTVHFNAFLISILAFMLFLYLYKVYQTQKLNEFLSAKLILYSLFFALMLFKVDYYKDYIHFGYPPDELAHLSYINYVHTHNDILPKFENMVMVNNKNAGNYLSHPPLYYQIANLVYDKSHPIDQNVNNFRTLSMIICMASFLLLLYLGFSAKIGLLGHFVYLSFISSIPMYAYIGASISNDNLAILGGSIFIIGLKRVIEKDYTNTTFLILAIGIFIAYFAKLTAALLIFFASVFFLTYAIRFKTGFKINKIQIVILTIAIVPILYYQFYIVSHYHALVPTFNVTHPKQYLLSGFFTPEQFRHYLTPYEWLQRMWHYIEGGWFGIHSHHSFTKNSLFGFIGLLVLHLFAIAALFFKCNKEQKSYCLIGKIALLSLFSVLVIQYIFSYHAHLKSGYLGGLQPRYMLPFMFSFAIMASLFAERFKQFFLFNISIIIICIQSIYSDFFYFLQYYQ